MGDEGRGNNTKESNGGDDNGDEEALLTGFLLGVLIELAILYWTDSNNNEPYPYI